ncbi:uncharacterized protein LOC110007837 [Amborella trichopoda]|nr:uncharacterized protein LOC110007837 [Amborella trichopoda]|eukprot:XP_020527195.1 uncharacterized protein LOC110007837 [Amborella trichopoda]
MKRKARASFRQPLEQNPAVRLPDSDYNLENGDEGSALPHQGKQGFHGQKKQSSQAQRIIRAISPENPNPRTMFKTKTPKDEPVEDYGDLENHAIGLSDLLFQNLTNPSSGELINPFNGEKDQTMIESLNHLQFQALPDLLSLESASETLVTSYSPIPAPLFVSSNHFSASSSGHETHQANLSNASSPSVVCDSQSSIKRAEEEEASHKRLRSCSCYTLEHVLQHFIEGVSSKTSQNQSVHSSADSTPSLSPTHSNPVFPLGPSSLGLASSETSMNHYWASGPSTMELPSSATHYTPNFSSSSSSMAPQSFYARQRRKRISELTRSLEKLMPWDSKMDTATMLGEAYKYIRFLKAQISVLKSMPSNSDVKTDCGEGNGEYSDFGCLSRQQMLQVLMGSSGVQRKLYSEGKCVISIEQAMQFQESYMK